MQDLYKSPYKFLIFSSLIVYLITAYFSIGYYHLDEHFQILEFCNYKLGKLPAEDLPWEFHERIRPTLQPIIAIVFIKFFNLFSITNPFTYSLLLRISTAVIAWFVISKMSILLVNKFTTQEGKKIFLFLSLLLGYIPFISVRFSSENFSAISFLSALYIVIKLNNDFAKRIQYKLIFVGLLLGFSFFFRFQIAFAILGFGLWLVFINKMNWENIFIIVFSFAFATVFCVSLDYWFYGEFELTPINYFYANIIQNKASNFGIEPWWFYFYNVINLTLILFGALLLLFFFIGLIKNPKDVFVWCLLPFLLVHFVIPHKEMRFLFPVVFCFSYITASGIDKVLAYSKSNKLGMLLFLLIIILNVPSLFINMFSPADPSLYFYKFLYDKSPKSEMVYISREPKTFDKWGLEINFYKSPNIKSIELISDVGFFNYLNMSTLDTLYVLDKIQWPEKKYNSYNNQSICKIYPDWILQFNINNWASRTKMLNIQELVKIDSTDIKNKP